MVKTIDSPTCMQGPHTLLFGSFTFSNWHFQKKQNKICKQEVATSFSMYEIEKVNGNYLLTNHHSQELLSLL